MQQNLSTGSSVETITNNLRQIKKLPFCIYISMHCNPCMLFLLCLSVPSQYYLEANCVSAVLHNIFTIVLLFSSSNACHESSQILLTSVLKICITLSFTFIFF